MIIVPVELADRSYSVVVGDGAVHELGSLIPPKARRAAIVTQASIPVDVETGTIITSRSYDARPRALLVYCFRPG